MRTQSATHSVVNCVGAARRALRAAAAVAAVAVPVAAVPSTATASPPTRITIVSVFDPVGFGDNDYVNGQIFGDAPAGQVVQLEQAPPPFTAWTPVGQATTDPVGYYSFKLHPGQTMQYRTSSEGMGSERVVQISVAPRLRFTAAAAGRTSVRFSGSIKPDRPGESIAIQRRTRSGWKTTATAALHRGRTFAGRMRARKPTDLRALFVSDGALLRTTSRAVTARPGAHASQAVAAACRRPAMTSITTTPARPTAHKPTALHVVASLPGGSLSSVDVLWDEGAARDHFTLAPAFRKPRVTFTLRHKFKFAGPHTLGIRVAGTRAGCTTTQTAHPRIQVRPLPETYQP